MKESFEKLQYSTCQELEQWLEEYSAAEADLTVEAKILIGDLLKITLKVAKMANH